jgi:nucleoside-diphosphate-sugar epimerase
MRAYWLTILHCRPGEIYNIGGTTAVKVGDFLDKLILLSSVPIKTRCDPELLRPADVTLQIPCVGKFSKETGWEPHYNFDESVMYLLEYWRKKADDEVRLRAFI